MKDTCYIEALHIWPPPLILKVRMIFAVMNATLAVVNLKPPKKKDRFVQALNP